ncbi:MAG TPA: septum formation initiator family protein [Candidatus Cloacimonadota bacterium]|nr:septum formation initiator family protein [Candidatus Cloacimonadota bacterium]HPT71266.1 septum formation initiator family protein [Candidatus Cloacimonadota bacterium]
MLKKRRSGGKIHQYIILGGLAFLLLYITIFDSSSFLKVIKSKIQNKKLSHEVSTVQKQNRSLMESNRNLKDNPAAIEKTAREKVGMQKPDEKVYRFFKEKK